MLAFILDIHVHGGSSGVHLMLKRSAVRSGDAYVQLAGERSVEKALSLNRKYLGHRYIEGVLSAGYLPSVISVKMMI